MKPHCPPFDRTDILSILGALAALALLVSIYAPPAMGVNPSLSGQRVSLRAWTDGVTTNVYQYTRSYTLPLQNTAVVRVQCMQNNPSTNSIKYQWSDDNSNWVDEVILTAGTVANGEQPYTPNTKVITLLATNKGAAYIERVNRLGPYFRLGIKDNIAVSTGRFEVVVQGFVN